MEPLTALAFVLIIGEVDGFHCGKQIASHLGLVPLEDSSGKRRRLGHITKQGSSILRFVLLEAAHVAARSLPEWRRTYFHLMMRRGRKIAKVALARKLAVRLYWMWRNRSCDRRDAWVGLTLDLKRLRASLRLEKAKPSTRAKWRSSLSARRSVLKKYLTPPTLSWRWEKSGRGGTEDETVKPLIGIQRV